jgi:hypothetical protein
LKNIAVSLLLLVFCFIFCYKKESELPLMNITPTNQGLLNAPNNEVCKTENKSNSVKNTKIKHLADYQALLADDVLKITFAVGFTEEYATIAGKGHVTIHDYTLDVLHQWLGTKDWKCLNRGSNPEIYTGQTTFKISGEVGFWEKNASIQLNILRPEAATAQLFGDALEDSEIVVYMGHSRFGIGPDFDNIKSKDGNFVIGINTPEHQQGLCQAASENAQLNVITPSNNALLDWATTHPTNTSPYRICFFNACNSFRYVDEWRSKIAPIALRDVRTDLFCTRGVVNLGAVAYSSVAFIDQLLEGGALETMPNLLLEVDKKARNECGLYLPEEVSGFHQVYFWDGIGDNPSFTPPLVGNVVQ